MKRKLGSPCVMAKLVSRECSLHALGAASAVTAALPDAILRLIARPRMPGNAELTAVFVKPCSHLQVVPGVVHGCKLMGLCRRSRSSPTVGAQRQSLQPAAPALRVPQLRRCSGLKCIKDCRERVEKMLRGLAAESVGANICERARRATSKLTAETARGEASKMENDVC